RAHRLQHGIEPLPHGLDPPRRRARQRRRTRRLEDVERLRRSILELVEDGALGVVRLDCLRNALDRPVGQAGGLPAAEVGFDASAAGGASSVATASVATASVAATIAARRFDRGIGASIAERVSAEYALVDVVVGVGPERVIRVGIEGVIDEVVVGVRPEQRAYPPDHDRVRKMASPLRIEEPTLEGRARDRAHAWVAGGSPVGKGLVAQHAAREGAWVAGRTGAGSRRWNGAARLILLHHTQLPRHVLLWPGGAAWRLPRPGGAEAEAPPGPGCARFCCWLGCATLAPPRPPRPLTCGCCWAGAAEVRGVGACRAISDAGGPPGGRADCCGAARG